MRNSVYAILAIIAVVATTGCKSNEDDLFDKYFDIPSALNVKYGEEFDVLTFKGGDDLMVVPSSTVNISYSIGDTSIVTFDRYEGVFKAVGIGSTTINLYNSDDEMVRSIPVNVEPNATITLKSGECRSIVDFYPEYAGQNLRAENSDIVFYISGDVLGLKAGTTILKTDSYVQADRGLYIQVEVIPGKLTDVFKSFDGMPYTVYESTIDSFMEGYDCTYDGERSYDGRSYYVKEYQPFDKANSVAFYFDNYGYLNSLRFAVVETDFESSEMLAWLCNNYDANKSNYTQGYINGFMTSNRYYNITPINGSWSNLMIKH